MNAAICLIVALAATQQPKAPREATQFDFWVGRWTCAGESHLPNGKVVPTKATNNVTREMNGSVVHEHFTMGGFKGESWSVYAANAKKWCQTWVDNQGSYIALTGEFVDGRMILIPTGPGQPSGTRHRMVFHDIRKDGFDWDWEQSPDDGRTWKPQWHLHYTRAK